MTPHLTSLPATTLFTSSMSCHMSQRLARALVLPILVVLVIELVPTSIEEEAEAPSGAALAASSLGLGSAT
jgi:diacylglycerol kinase